MKRAVPIVWLVAIAVLAGMFTGCEGLFPDVPLPQEQVQGFLTAASAVPQVPTTMRDYFATDAADYGNMYLDTYWDSRFFNDVTGPYAILNIADGGEDPDFPGSKTVTGNVTNLVNTDVGYPAVFVLTTDATELFPSPLIRKITVTVDETTEVIERVEP